MRFVNILSLLVSSIATAPQLVLPKIPLPADLPFPTVIDNLPFPTVIDNLPLPTAIGNMPLPTVIDIPGLPSATAVPNNNQCVNCPEVPLDCFPQCADGQKCVKVPGTCFTCPEVYCLDILHLPGTDTSSGTVTVTKTVTQTVTVCPNPTVIHEPQVTA